MTPKNPTQAMPAKLFYDGSCPLCRREMRLLAKLKSAALHLVDIHSLDSLNSLERAQRLRRLHLQLADGSWRYGIEANVLAWSYTPIGFLWRPLRWRLWSGLVDYLYERWAEKRYANRYSCGPCSLSR